MLTKRWLVTFVAVVAILSLLAACARTPAPEVEGKIVKETVVVEVTRVVEVPAKVEKWCSGMTIRFFCGGEAGDAFASIVYKGALDAEMDLGAVVEYVFSGWNMDKMVDQFREAVAAKPDGIAMMGHPGDDALMSLAKGAYEAGIPMMYQNVDVPKVRAKYGGGYIGAILTPQGRALGAEAVRQLGLKAGDEAIVIGTWGQPGRFYREEGTAVALEEAGLTVHRISDVEGMGSDPSLLIAPLSAAFLANPKTKIIVYPGGQTLGAAQMYMEAIGKGPGEVYNIGYDTSPAVIDAFEKGYVQLTSDQQPYLQGYLPILSLCLTKVYGFGPITFDTGAGFVDQNNYKNVADWAIKGYR
ncbi:MAG: substrate-binding domain-containing protein [Anaerolineae bacterium]